MNILIWFTIIILSSIRYKEREFRFLPYILLFVFMGIRVGFGDYGNYLDIFSISNHVGGSFSNELFFNYIFYKAPSFTFIIVLTSFIFTLGVYLLFEKICDSRYRTLYFVLFLLNPYIFLMDMSAMRQGCAIAVMLLGLYLCLKTDKWWIFIIFGALSMTMHISGVLYIPCAILLLMKKFSWKRCVFIFVSCLFLLCVPQFMHFAIQVVNKVVLHGKYDNYLEWTTRNSIPATLSAFAIFSFILFQTKEMSSDELVIVRFAVIGLVCEILQYRMQILGRVVMDFNIFYPMAIIYAVKYPIKMSFGKISHVFSKAWNYIFLVAVICLYIWKLRMIADPQWAYSTIFSQNIYPLEAIL